MSKPLPGTRLVLLIAVLTNPFCWLPCMTAAQSALPDLNTADVRGAVFVVDSDSGRSVIAGASVRLEGPDVSIRTITDQQGNYSFTSVAPATYQIEVQPATPDLHQHGYMASIQHRYAIGPDSLLLSQFSYKRFDADVTANSNDPYRLLIETTAGGFFNRQKRETDRTEWQESYQFGARNFLGSHQFKIGIDFAHSDYDGRVELLPVTIIGVSHRPIERINFGPASRFDLGQNEIAWFAADSWRPLQRLTLDRFAALFNGVGRTFRGKFVLEF